MVDEHITPMNPKGRVAQCRLSAVHAPHEFQYEFGDYWDTHCPGIKNKPKPDEIVLQKTAEGYVSLAKQYPESICPICNKPIRWCLDLFSFTTGFNETLPYTLAHATCVWKRTAFLRLAEEAPTEED